VIRRPVGAPAPKPVVVETPAESGGEAAAESAE